MCGNCTERNGCFFLKFTSAASGSVHNVNIDLDGAIDDRLGVGLIEQVHKDVAVLQGNAGIGGHRVAVNKAAIGGGDIQQGTVRDDTWVHGHGAIAQA